MDVFDKEAAFVAIDDELNFMPVHFRRNAEEWVANAARNGREARIVEIVQLPMS